MSRRYGDGREGVKRTYVSPYRADQADRTRLRVLAAAVELFSTQGYAATTVEDVARAAGVSRPTVFSSVGSKRELAKQARDVALAGDDEPVAMQSRPWVDELRDAATPRVAAGVYARMLRAVYGRAAALELAISSGADADPELRDLAETARLQRHSGCRLVAETLAAKAPLRDGMSVDEAADVLFGIASPEVYRLLVAVRGWTPERYESWLARSIAEQLCGQGSLARS